MRVEDTKPVFVLDTSFALAWILDEEQEKRIDAVFDLLNQRSAVVPSLWFYEVSNALLMNEKRGRLSQTDTVRAITLLNALPLIIDSDCETRAFREIIALARTHNLTVYDATYLDIAMRMSLPLATLDNSLMRASQSLHVKIL